MSNDMYKFFCAVVSDLQKKKKNVMKLIINVYVHIELYGIKYKYL